MGQTKELVKNVVRDFNAGLQNLYPANEIMSFVYLLFDEYLQWPKTKVHLSYEVSLNGQTLSRFRNALEKLSLGEPIQYIIGKGWFNGLTLSVTPDVLVPRPETEGLCRNIYSENIQNQYLDISILDIGTGSGCIAIDLKKKFPYAWVTGTDISEKALRVAGHNAAIFQLPIDFIGADILLPLHWGRFGVYDLIVSNPPYVTESEKRWMHRNVVEFEPPSALFVPEDEPLKFYSAIGAFASLHLRRSGSLWVEINERFGKEVRDLFREMNFQKVEVLQDFFGKDRFVKAVANPGLTDISWWYADKGDQG